MDTNLDVKIALEDTKAALQRQFETMNVMRDIAKTIISASAIIVSVLGLVITYVESPPFYSSSFFIILAASMALFACVMGFSIYILMPLKFSTPIKIDWDEFQATYFGKDERELLKVSLSSYINVIDLNKPKLERRRFFCVLTGIGFVFVVFGMVALTLFK
jgi:hypothetical protein